MVILSIDSVNWRDRFPEAPQTDVHVSLVPLSEGDGHYAVHIAYHVIGRQLRALAINDQEPVWEDSCVEFFCRVLGQKHYFNFETNCIGTMVASRRLSRTEDVRPLSPEQMALIRRHCSLPHERIEERDGMFEWSVEITVPLALIFGKEIPVTKEGIVLEANFYKCGDKTRYPHFLSWNPIHLPDPDFHCPDFFAPLHLQP